MSKILLPIALGLGLLIAYVDSRPNCDDTGLSALALLACSGLCGVFGPNRPWLWASAVGMWILFVGIAFAGAYSAMVFRKRFRPVC